jgi:multidrug resistance protein, MATE family
MGTKALTRSKISKEVQEFLQLAVPLASAQLAQAAVGFVDTIMMGHLGAETLAAGGLASVTFQLLLNTASGLVMAVSPLVAEAYGAGRTTQIEQIARQGLWLSLLLGLPLTVAIANLDAVLLVLQQPASLVSLADRYFDFIAWGIFPALGFAMLRILSPLLSSSALYSILPEIMCWGLVS